MSEFRFCCEVCQHYTNKKSNIDNHNISARHIQKCLAPVIEPVAPVISNEVELLKLEILHLKEKMSSLEAHTASVEAHNEFLQQLLLKSPVTVIANKPFHLETYLNEDCKDAIDIVELKTQLAKEWTDADILSFDKGFVAGSTKFILKHLKKIKQNLSPIQVNDVKRDTCFIKVADEWKEDNSLLLSLVTFVTGRVLSDFAYNLKEEYDINYKYKNIYEEPFTHVMDSSPDKINQIARNIIMQCGIVKK